MKLSVAYFAFANVRHAVLGQELSTFLHGSGAEGAVAEEDELASFGDIFNSYNNSRNPCSLRMCHRPWLYGGKHSLLKAAIR